MEEFLEKEGQKPRMEKYLETEGEAVNGEISETEGRKP